MVNNPNFNSTTPPNNTVISDLDYLQVSGGNNQQFKYFDSNGILQNSTPAFGALTDYTSGNYTQFSHAIAWTVLLQQIWFATTRPFQIAEPDSNGPFTVPGNGQLAYTAVVGKVIQSIAIQITRMPANVSQTPGIVPLYKAGWVAFQNSLGTFARQFVSFEQQVFLPQVPEDTDGFIVQLEPGFSGTVSPLLLQQSNPPAITTPFGVVNPMSGAWPAGLGG